MITTIDNFRRVFQIVGNDGTQVFCNLEEINRSIKEWHYKEGTFIIFQFWNNRPRKMTSKTLKEMFKANEIKQEFKY